MSLNYNSALLKTLKTPLLDEIRSVQSDLKSVDEGSKRADEINLRGIANIHGSFMMMGYPSMINVSANIKLSLEKLQAAEKSGWDRPRIAAVSKLCFNLIGQLADHVTAIESGEKDYAVRMHPTLSSLRAMIDAQPLDARLLFDPDPTVPSEGFAELDTAVLRDAAAPHLARLTDAIASLPSAMDTDDRQALVRKMGGVFDWAHSLKHRRGFHAFWLAARARVAIEMLQPSVDVVPFRDAMKVCLTELGKFSEDARKPKPESLQILMFNMLDRWPEAWAGHPVLLEVEEVFGLDDFWRAHSEMRDSGNSKSEQAFVARQDDLLDSVHGIKAAWTKVCAEENADVRPLLRALLPFLSSYEKFPNPGVRPLMESLKALANRFVNLKNTEVTPEIEQEVAIAILLVEETIEKKGRWTSDLEAQAELVKKRVSAAVADRFEELEALPTVSWSAHRMRQQSQDAIAKVASAIRSDLVFIEETFDEFFRRDVQEAKSHFNDARMKAYTSKSILQALGQHKAASIMDVVFSLVGILNRQTLPSEMPREQATLTLAITGLSSFLTAVERGDSSAGQIIDQVMGQLGLTSEKADRSIDEIVTSFQPKTATVFSSTAILPSQDKMASDQAFAEKSVSSAFPIMDRVEDEEIAECFFEEANSVFEEIELLRSKLKASPASSIDLADLRRQFHTLKGSGRVAQIWGLGEVAKRVEERFSEAIGSGDSYSDAMDRLVTTTKNIISDGVAALTTSRESELSSHQSKSVLNALAASRGQAEPFVLDAPIQDVFNEIDSSETSADHADLERAEAERLDLERIEAERPEAERFEAERFEAERFEAERLEAERFEAERLEVERIEAERLEAERLEAERLEAERLEAERLEAERFEADRLEVERIEAERAEAERIETERLEAERLDADRAEAERIEAERLDADRAEAERLEAERLEVERLDADSAELEHLDVEQAGLESIEVESAAIVRLEDEQAVVGHIEAEQTGMESLEVKHLETEQADAIRLDAEHLEAEHADRTEMDSFESFTISMDDVVEDFVRHLENLNDVASSSPLNIKGLNWSAHTIASLSLSIGQQRLHDFSRALERKVDFSTGFDDDVNFDLEDDQRRALKKAVYLLIEKVSALLDDPHQELVWDVLDDTVASEIESLSVNPSQGLSTSFDDKHLQDAADAGRQDIALHTLEIQITEGDDHNDVISSDSAPGQEERFAMTVEGLSTSFDDKRLQDDAAIDRQDVEPASEIQEATTSEDDHVDVVPSDLVPDPEEHFAAPVEVVVAHHPLESIEADAEDFEIDDRLTSSAMAGVDASDIVFDDRPDEPSDVTQDTDDQDEIWDEIDARMASIVEEMAALRVLFSRAAKAK